MAALFEDPKALAEALKTARTDARWTIDKLAEEAGVSATTVKRWEKGYEGKRKPKSSNERRAIAILVAELTGANRASLGLDPPTATDDGDVDRLHREVVSLRLQLRSEIGKVQRGLEALRKTQELGERTEGGSSN